MASETRKDQPLERVNGPTARPLSRRALLERSLASGLALTMLPLLNACSVASSPTGAPGGTKAGDTSKVVFPTYQPVSNGPKPDYHDDNPLYSVATGTWNVRLLLAP